MKQGFASAASVHAKPATRQAYAGRPSKLLQSRFATIYLFAFFAVLLIVTHAPLLRLPYFWDEAGYYIPAARDLAAGSLVPHSTPSNAHPPLVLAWLAASWKLFGFHPAVTRCAMLLLSAFSLLGFFQLARAVSNSTIASWATFLTAIYPVFFAQSSLAQVDLPAAGLVFWGLAAYVRKRLGAYAIWFSLAALAKETAILVPLALFGVEVFKLVRRRLDSSAAKTAKLDDGSGGTVGNCPPPSSDTPNSPTVTFSTRALLLLIPTIPLAAWYAYHYARTGFVFGNPEFFRYNAQATLHPVRMFLALLLRLWQATAYMNLYVLTLGCALAMRQPPIEDSYGSRPRIAVPTQLTFVAIIMVYVIALSVVGGAVLARYLLAAVPLVILISVSTIWRRLWICNWVLTIVAAGFVAALFVNPPYGFAPEDNLAYRDYIQLHRRAEQWLQTRYPNTRVLTAWPASGELTKPDVGYVAKPMRVVQIEDFTAEHLLSASELDSQFDVALVFSTKYEAHSILDGWKKWQEWKAHYFDFHRDVPPEIAASILGGKLVYVERRQGQWVGIVAIERVERAGLSNFPISGVPGSFGPSNVPSRGPYL